MAYVVNELHRFRMLFAGVLLGLAISSSYGFSIFTEHMKHKYGFTQGDITTISTVGNCCGYLVFFMGILFDYAGPRVVLPLAGVLAFVGYVLFGLAFDDVIRHDSRQTMMYLFCVFCAIMYYGCPSLDLSTLMPLMLNFPLDRGYMVIIQKTFSGLGTSVLMAYYSAWFMNVDEPSRSNFSGYAYFLAAQILGIALLGCYLVDFPPYYLSHFRRARIGDADARARQATLTTYMQQRAPQRRFYIGCSIIVVMLCFLTATSIVNGYTQISKPGLVAIAVVAVLLVASFALLALPLQCLGAYTPIAAPHPQFAQLGLPAQHTPDNDDDDNDDDGSGVRPPAPVRDGGDKDNNDDDDTATAAQTSVGDPQYGGSFWSHLLTLDLWLLWVGFFGAWGTGTVMIMNAAQIYRSSNYGDYNQSVSTLYVTLIGVGSALGRITSGVIDMVISARKQRGTTRLLTTTFLPLGSGMLCVAYLFFAVLPAKALLLPFLLGAFGNGAGWGLGSLAVRLMYAEDIGKHYNFMYSSGFVSTIVLNRVMFGGLFDKRADALHSSPYCNEPSCVRTQMYILLAVNAVSVVAVAIAHVRFARFVARERARHAAAAATASAATTAVAPDDEPTHEREVLPQQRQATAGVASSSRSVSSVEGAVAVK